MNYYFLIGVFVLASKTYGEANGTITNVNGTSANATTVAAAATTGAAPTTAAPPSYGSSIFAQLINEFDALKAKDEGLTEKVRALKSKVSTLTSKVATLTDKDAALTSKVATLTSKDNTFSAEVNALKAKVSKLKNDVIPGKYTNIRLTSTKRLEVRVHGEWGTVCDDEFDSNDARVACRQMGKTGGVKYYSSWGHQGNSATGKIWLDDLACTGSESSLFDCPRNGLGNHNCGHHETVHMYCSS